MLGYIIIMQKNESHLFNIISFAKMSQLENYFEFLLFLKKYGYVPLIFAKTGLNAIKNVKITKLVLYSRD